MKILFFFKGTIKPLLFLWIFNAIIGCLSVKPTATKSGKNLFETFYVGDDGIQYFIKPLNMKNTQNSDELKIDFTFRHKDEIKDSVVVNVSLRSSAIYKNIDSLSLSNETHKIVSDNLRLLFNEERNDLYTSRFTTKVPLIDVVQLFDTNDWILTIHKNQAPQTYIPEKNTKKAILKLQEKLFILFR
jgi:hypothetical protein